MKKEINHYTKFMKQPDKLTIRQAQIILKKQYYKWKNLEKDIREVILKMDKQELNLLAFIVGFEYHISEFIIDSIIELRKYKEWVLINELNK